MTDTGLRHFIIGGTIKAATSALFNTLGKHPQVCASKIKETYFFSQGYSGDADADLAKYASYFSPQAGHRVLMEASPNYLAYKEKVASRIRTLLPEVKILFLLRNPAGRLYSHFNFARGKLEIPQDMSFEQFIDLCERFNQGLLTPAEAGIAEKNLRALEIGNYASYLPDFFEHFDAADLRVIFYDDLGNRPQEIILEICEFIDVDPDIFQNHAMDKTNVTFSGRMKLLHSIALLVNRSLESVFRRFPAFKRALVKVYKLLNQERKGYAPMQETTWDKLTRYYAPSNARLKIMLADQALPVWIERE